MIFVLLIKYGCYLYWHCTRNDSYDLLVQDRTLMIALNILSCIVWSNNHVAIVSLMMVTLLHYYSPWFEHVLKTHVERFRAQVIKLSRQQPFNLIPCRYIIKTFLGFDVKLASRKKHFDIRQATKIKSLILLLFYGGKKGKLFNIFLAPTWISVMSLLSLKLIWHNPPSPAWDFCYLLNYLRLGPETAGLTPIKGFI